jgi:cysteine-rich repeat protein
MSRRWLVAVSILAHLCILVGVFVSGIWRIERLDRDRHVRIDGWHPPPPPAASGGPVAKVEFTNHPKQPPIVKTTVQPTPHVDTPPRPPDDPPGEGSGSGSGSGDRMSTCTENCGPATAPPADPVCGNGSVEAGEQCDDGNTAGGDGCSSTCRTEPVRPQTAVILPSVLSGLRTSGETQVHPGPTTQNQMMRDGASRIEGIVKLCVDTGGNVASARMMRSTH